MKIKVLSLLVIYLVNSALSSEQQTQVHHELSDNEFQRIFRRERQDVPDYDFVNITPRTGHRAKRELRPVEFQVDGYKKVELNLHPAEHIVMSYYIPVWRTKTEQARQYNYKPVAREERTIDGTFYEDPQNMATLLAYNKDRYIYYDGVFGESTMMKVVRAVREKWRDSASTTNSGKHFIFNVSSSGNTVALQPSEIDRVSEKLDKPLDTFYPKLLVVVDHSLFKVLNNDIQETVKYVATFWNAVNLKYSKIEHPKIKVMVTGLIISEDPTAMDCVYKSRDQTKLENINPHKLLDLCGKYFRDEFYNVTKFENYDATITMASLYSGSVIGVTYRAAICGDTQNVGYLKDDGNFAGVIAATHELGHLLSLYHDNEYGCELYAKEKSTVMLSHAAQVEEYLWSECSKKYLQMFAWNKKASCLKNYYRYRH